MPRKGGVPATLKPCRKGETHNPHGRPRKLPALDTLMADIVGEEKDGVTAAKAILMAIRAKASRGDVRAAEVLLDRGYGRAKLHADITTNGKDITPVSTLTEQERREKIELLKAKLLQNPHD